MVVDTSLVHRLVPYGDALAANRFTFNSSVGDIGIITLPYDRVMALTLLKIWPDGVLPYDVIRDWPVAPRPAQRVQLEILAPRVKSIADSITSTMLLGPLRDLAPMSEVFVLKNQHVNAPPDEEKVILDSLVAITPEGAVRGPVRGIHGYYFLRVITRTGPTETEFQRDRAAFTADYTGRYRAELLEKELKQLRSDAEVADLRTEQNVTPVRQ